MTKQSKANQFNSPEEAFLPDKYWLPQVGFEPTQGSSLCMGRISYKANCLNMYCMVVGYTVYQWTNHSIVSEKRVELFPTILHLFSYRSSFRAPRPRTHVHDCMYKRTVYNVYTFRYIYMDERFHKVAWGEIPES